MKSIWVVLTCLTVFATSPAIAKITPLQAQMIQSLDIVKSSFMVMYAPKEWKKKHANWDLDSAIKSAKKRIRANPKITVPEFRQIVRGFFKSVKDYHVSVSFYATESAYLPLKIRGAQGRYFVVYIDREKLPKSTFPIKVGSEIIAFGKKPVGPVVATIKEELGGNTAQTDQALAEDFLTSRKASRGMAVPRGPIELSFRVKNKVVSRQLTWIYTEEKVEPPGSSRGTGELKPFTQAEKQGAYLKMSSALALDAAPKEMSGSPFKLGSKYGFLPPLGKILWSAPRNSTFHAYLAMTPERILVGFLRLSTFSPENPMQAAKEFSQVVSKFQKDADIMVIDQTNNGGGYVSYMYALAAMLTDKPLDNPKHRTTLTQRMIYQAQRRIPRLEQVTNTAQAQRLIGPWMLGYPVDYQYSQMMLEHHKFQVAQWRAGKIYTDPGYLRGVDKINPHPLVQFTKPLVVLINELDFSCADFFPAILKDNKRAVLMGTRTSGAGGYVHGVQFPPNLLGIAGFNLTGSLAERVNKRPIENLGVEPHIKYEVTVEDLQKGFSSYARAIYGTVRNIVIPPKKKGAKKKK